MRKKKIMFRTLPKSIATEETVFPVKALKPLEPTIYNNAPGELMVSNTKSSFVGKLDLGAGISMHSTDDSNGFTFLIDSSNTSNIFQRLYQIFRFLFTGRMKV